MKGKIPEWNNMKLAGKDLPPGSPEAVAAGCTCPRIDNHHGRGYRTNIGTRPRFVITKGCPLHWSVSNAR